MKKVEAKIFYKDKGRYTEYTEDGIHNIFRISEEDYNRILTDKEHFNIIQEGKVVDAYLYDIKVNYNNQKIKMLLWVFD